MFVRLQNTPRDYAWGSHGEITRLLGDRGANSPRSDDGPEAELWLGAHHGSPSRIVDAEQAGGHTNLRDWIEAEPEATLGRFATGLRPGDGPQLPFLVKVLAAGAPLSLQAHPSLDHARAGFERENALGLPLNAPIRSYKDCSHKPELLLALSETMEALAGFRDADAVVELVRLLAAAGGDEHRAPLADLLERATRARDEHGRRELVAWLLAREPEALAATEGVVAAAAALTSQAVDGDRGETFALVGELAERYPGDPGVVIALMLNRVTLRRGQAIFIGAGNLHAYLSGVGLEIMASSDNVLRGGLTPKHVDIAELLHILNASDMAPPFVTPTEVAPGVHEFAPDVEDFALTRVTRREGAAAASRLSTGGPAIALCLDGAPVVQGRNHSIRMRAGEAVFITPDEHTLEVQGECDLLVATVGAVRGPSQPG